MAVSRLATVSLRGAIMARNKRQRKQDRLQQQAEQRQIGLVREFVDFLRYNKKWWLLPIVIVMLLLGVLVVLSGSGAAPFIYTVF